jgi:hypothetical protein
MLIGAALVTSFILNVQAGPITLSRAHQTHGNSSVNPIHRLLFPTDTYMIDDGTAENAFGLFFSGDLIALNEFPVIPGQETINEVSIAWGDPAFPDPSLDGVPYTVCIWSDPDGDGSPTDAQLLTTAAAVVSAPGTNTFITTNIAATITTPNFFVGFLITQPTSQLPAAFDETSPIFSNRGYLAYGIAPGSGDINNLNNNDQPVISMESYACIGNWLIRANTIDGGPDITLTANKRRQNGKTVVSLNWTPSGSDSVFIYRNRLVIRATEDDGSAQDNLGHEYGSFLYQVCVEGSSNCSNEVLLRVRPRGD